MRLHAPQLRRHPWSGASVHEPMPDNVQSTRPSQASVCRPHSGSPTDMNRSPTLNMLLLKADQAFPDGGTGKRREPKPTCRGKEKTVEDSWSFIHRQGLFAWSSAGHFVPAGQVRAGKSSPIRPGEMGPVGVSLALVRDYRTDALRARQYGVGG